MSYWFKTYSKKAKSSYGPGSYVTSPRLLSPVKPTVAETDKENIFDVDTTDKVKKLEKKRNTKINVSKVSKSSNNTTKKRTLASLKFFTPPVRSSQPADKSARQSARKPTPSAQRMIFTPLAPPLGTQISLSDSDSEFPLLHLHDDLRN